MAKYTFTIESLSSHSTGQPERPISLVLHTRVDSDSGDTFSGAWPECIAWMASGHPECSWIETFVNGAVCFITTGKVPYQEDPECSLFCIGDAPTILTHDQKGIFYRHAGSIIPECETLVSTHVRHLHEPDRHEAWLDGKWIDIGGKTYLGSPFVEALKLAEETASES